jgi:hypothetical protein
VLAYLVGVMKSPKRFREYADEYVARAKEAESVEQRELFLKVAQDWLSAASTLEGLCSADHSLGRRRIE